MPSDCTYIQNSINTPGRDLQQNPGAGDVTFVKVRSSTPIMVGGRWWKKEEEKDTKFYKKPIESVFWVFLMGQVKSLRLTTLRSLTAGVFERESLWRQWPGAAPGRGRWTDVSKCSRKVCKRLPNIFLLVETLVIVRCIKTLSRRTSRIDGNCIL